MSVCIVSSCYGSGLIDHPFDPDPDHVLTNLLSVF